MRRWIVGIATLGVLVVNAKARAADPEIPPAIPSQAPPAVQATTAAGAPEPTTPEVATAPQAPPSDETRAAAPRPKPLQYSLPWQLRPITAATVIRSDTTFAKYENAASAGGFTVVSNLIATYRVPGTGTAAATGLTPILRLALVNDSPPSGTGGLAIVNPLLGAAWAVSFGDGFRASAFLGATVPVGMGGGDKPDPGELDARKQGPAARSAMDNALFAVNDLAVIPGVDLAWVSRGVTIQAEATFFQLTRVRGAAAQLEASKTNFTCGLHVGWFALDALSFGAELRYQRWLNGPIAIDKDPNHLGEDNLTFAVGPRLHVPVGAVIVRPGVSFARGLNKPLASAALNYDMVQIDVPVVF